MPLQAAMQMQAKTLLQDITVMLQTKTVSHKEFVLTLRVKELLLTLLLPL